MTDDTDLKAREDRARRALARAGYTLRKTPSRSQQRKYYEPGYSVIENYTNVVREGCASRMYDATIERVEWFAFEHLPAKQASRA
jgi:hypothetical protein